jgi:hypothetical protein
VTRMLAKPAVLFIGFGLAALLLRALQLHEALVYPDGYQYLLMARGIAEHGRPTTMLGEGGDLFVPNVDASLKPLFPLLVAAVHLCGATLRDAADAITVLAEAAVVALVGALALRLTGSRVAGAAASALCLASAGLAFWSGFAGPDALAQALALASALALAGRRWRLGGALAGACIAARPEFALIAFVAAALAATRPSARRPLASAGAAAVVSLGAVLAVVRPPVALPEAQLLVQGAAAAAVMAALLVIVLRRPRVTPAVGLAATAVALVAARPAWSAAGGGTTLLHTEWPLLTAGLCGLLLALLGRALRFPAAAVAVGAALLALVYHAKNPELARYAAVLLPLLALGVAFGVAELMSAHRGRLTAAVVPAAATVALALALALAPQPRVGPDPFVGIARQLGSGSATPLVTAAPDAYGFLLAPRPVTSLRAGRAGLVLLDGAQRAYAPDVRVEGVEVARLSSTGFLLRLDRSVDRRPAILARGIVAPADGYGRRAGSAMRSDRPWPLARR